MQEIQHYMSIDMLRETVSGTIYVRNSSVGHRLTAALTQSGKVLDLPGANEGVVQFVYQKPGGAKSDAQMTVNGRSASLLIPRAALDENGVVECEIRVYQTGGAGTWTTTPKFTMTVDNVIYDASAQQTIVSDPTVYEQIVASEAARVAAEEERQAGYATMYTKAQTDALLAGKQDNLTFDPRPTKYSLNPVTSDGIYEALENGQQRILQGAFTLDDALTGAEVMYGGVMQIGSIVYVSLAISLPDGIGGRSVRLGTITGVDAPEQSVVPTPCVTSDLDGNHHHAATAMISRLSDIGLYLLCTETYDTTVYINTFYIT